MKPITTFLLGIAFTLLISATTVSIMTVKPAQPKSIITKGFPYYDDAEIQKEINVCVKEGYVLKSLNGAGGSGGSYWYLVMEKY